MRKAPDRICGAMLNLMQTKSVDSITVKELIAEAGVSRSSYNYNFYTMQDVIDRIISGITDGVVDVMDRAYRSDLQPSGINVSLYSDVFQYIYSQREKLRLLDNAGYRDRIRNRLFDSLIDFFGKWSYVYEDADGKEELLSDGMVYILKNTENASRLVADFTFCAQYDYSLPSDFFDDIIRTSRHIRVIRAEPKKSSF